MAFQTQNCWWLSSYQHPLTFFITMNSSLEQINQEGHPHFWLFGNVNINCYSSETETDVSKSLALFMCLNNKLAQENFCHCNIKLLNRANVMCRTSSFGVTERMTIVLSTFSTIQKRPDWLQDEALRSGVFFSLALSVLLAAGET